MIFFGSCYILLHLVTSYNNIFKMSTICTNICDECNVSLDTIENQQHFFTSLGFENHKCCDGIFDSSIIYFTNNYDVNSSEGAEDVKNFIYSNVFVTF